MKPKTVVYLCFLALTLGVLFFYYQKTNQKPVKNPTIKMVDFQ